VHLESIDKALLAGELGEPARRAMNLLLRYGEVLGADRFIDIESAHIDSCLYHGRSGLDFVRSLSHGDCKVRVRTTLNVTAFDLDHPGHSRVSDEEIRIQKDMVEAYLQLGCLPTMTCAPYQHLPRPGFGQDVAWAESNAIVFVNSVLGARTDRYGDFTDICAALAGRVPLAGLHREENRLAVEILAVPTPRATGLERDLYFASLGYLLGKAAGSRVLAIDGAPQDATEDELKAVGAAAASSGGVAMFHVIGVTPEAATLNEATGGKSVTGSTIEAGDLVAVSRHLCTAEPGEPIAALCVGTPHFSIDEFKYLAALAEGRTPAPGVDVLVTTSREIASRVEAAPWAESLWTFGVKLVTDTCTYLVPAAIRNEGLVVTNSAKYAHYARGNTGRPAALMSLERCVRCAAAGEVVR
jgi:predicted aconitase